MPSTKDHIIEVASRLVHLRGFNHTSIGEILLESGIGKGNFYYYFRSKEELGYAIIENNFRRFSAEVIDNAFGNHKDALTQLDDFLDMLIDIHRRQNCTGGCRLGNMAIEMSDIHEEFRKRCQEVFNAWRVHMETVLRKAKASGQLSEQANIFMLAHFIIASVEGAILLARVQKDVGILEQCFAELKNHIRMYAGCNLPLPT
ncbi:MAG: hypothetical protein C3F08_04535 [Candidatus Methylomirabilota bacterium]|nr:MAG: hypothetical protein C3F08_04535 [candidate division NC10 bacterium]